MLVRRGDLIGSGGMAEVFRGELLQGATAIQQVAIKCMRSTRDERIGRLFEREARIVAALSHPNIVSLIDVIQDDTEPPVLIMELVEGIALSRLVGTPRPQPLIVYIGIQVLQALAHAHARGVVHRDVSPHNVLLSLAGEVKLTDFGLSQFASFDHTTLTGCKGKIGYMSPEQAYGTDIDSRADLFAVGIMLYELATGALPFEVGILPDFLHQLFSAPIPAPRTLRPELQPELEVIILGLLERNRDQRFASAGDVLDALAALPSAGAGELAQLVADSHDTNTAQHAPRAGREHITIAPQTKSSRRYRLPAAVIALGLLAGLLHATLLDDRTSPPSAPAELAGERPAPDSAATPPEPAFEPPAVPPEPAAATHVDNHEPPPVAAVPPPAMAPSKHVASAPRPKRPLSRPAKPATRPRPDTKQTFQVQPIESGPFRRTVQ